MLSSQSENRYLYPIDFQTGFDDAVDLSMEEIMGLMEESWI
jgi:hypothetical protein